MAKRLNLDGQKFGRLTVKEIGSRTEKGSWNWKCVCECGTELEVTGSSLKSNLILSCGCLYKESRKTCHKKHGMSRTREYNAWTAMRQRCYYENHDYYSEYGGRGITVCGQWRDDFAQFYADMGDCPPGLSIERVDVNGNYCPENCKWETASNQGFNTRMHSTNKSGKTGVCWHKATSKWMASIRADGVRLYLGVFASFEEAVKAREEAELKYYGRTKE